MSYQWRFWQDSRARTQFLFLPAVTAARAGRYSVLVSNAGGAVLSVEVTLTVIVPPTITTPPQNVTVVAGQSATFTVGVSGSAPFSYQWFKGGVTVSGATGASLTINPAQPADEGLYTAQVSNLAGDAISPGATLTVLVPPVITTPPQGATVAVGSTVTLSVAVTGTPPLSYQWKKNGADLPGKHRGFAELANVATSDSGITCGVEQRGRQRDERGGARAGEPPAVGHDAAAQSVGVLGANVTLFVGRRGRRL